MKSEKLGWLSAVLASVCCLVPVAAALIGLGSAGLGSTLGSLSPYFYLGGLTVLACAWFYFARERRKACALNTDVGCQRRAVVALSVASVIVAFFAGSGLAPIVLKLLLPPAKLARTSQARASQRVADNPGAYLRKVLAVKGMDCAACVPVIKGNLDKVEGVRSIEVSLRDQTVTVEYNPAKASAERLLEAIKAAGYEARVVN